MDSTPRPSLPGSQRTLAAILFTDVVGFSARMQREEVRTLALLQRDFATMRQLCTEHEGAVLKTTGDGLLMRFTSAVQAVACALAMQKYFAELAKTLGAKETLQHRIGIHLGDVLVQNEDVMGDGVNIASRIQAEAEPGGICISQTVLDVVGNKLALQVVSLGPRDLKNITEAVPVYRLLLEAQELGSRVPFASGTVPPPLKSRRGTTRRVLYLGAIAAALLLAFLAGSFVREPARPPATVAEGATNTGRNRNAGEKAPGMGRKAVNAEVDAARRDNLLQLRDTYQTYLDKYDFEGMARELRAKRDEPAGKAATQFLIRTVEQMQAAKTWTMNVLKRHPRGRPLRVTDVLGKSPGEASVFLGPDNRLHFLSGGPPAIEWVDLRPAMLGNIIVSLLQDSPVPPTRDVIIGAQAFGRLYDLPAMPEAILAARPRREKDQADK